MTTIKRKPLQVNAGNRCQIRLGLEMKKCLDWIFLKQKNRMSAQKAEP